MTIPRITRTCTFRAHGFEAEAMDDRGMSLYFLATAEESEDARTLAKAGAVRVTIEPADATPEEAPHGSALDYLDELKSLLTGALEARGVQSDEQTDRALRRCLSLANSASLAILNERRK
jgi:hypothetical protein